MARTATRSDFHVVDESDVVIKHRGSEKSGSCDAGEELQVLAVDQFEVVDFQSGRGIVQKMMAGGLKIDFAALFSGLAQIAGSEEGTVDTGSISAVLLVQGEVA